MYIQVEQDTTLMEVLAKAFPQSSRTHLKKVIKYGFITKGAHILRNSEIVLKKGERIDYHRYDGKEAKKVPAPFRILFEDESVIAVMKPAGILSVGAADEKKASMYKVVSDFLNQNDQKLRLRVVHRLDREVSGIILFAKTEQAKHELIQHWDKNEKIYHALVEGHPEPKRGTIESWLVEGPKQKMLSFAEIPRQNYSEGKEPKWSVTHYETIEPIGEYSLLKIHLETGRKNQIRVHLSSIGHPIVGDRKYEAEARFIRQVRLFASELHFRHPVSKKTEIVHCPLPKNFCKIGYGDEKY